MDARDNGFMLFKWIRENHPDINMVYAIDKKSPDAEKVVTIGPVVQYGSYRHWYYYFVASVCCGTGWDICAPESLAYVIMRNICPPQGKRVFLQHGITKDYMPQAQKNKLNADIFVCGAYPEWEYIKTTFGYRDDEVKYIGFARFDNLCDTSERNRILYMPTWRMNLKTSDNNFESTTYFQKIQSLLISERLNDFLAETQTEFVFFIHPAIRDKIGHFLTFANRNIKVLSNATADMHDYICSAKMLVTDYSSIYFDFAYQNKPVVYYQFDYDDYRKGHYAEGYFSYQRDGFGPIVTTADDTVDAIEGIFRNQWRQSAVYAERTKRFFPLQDRNNCLRHYEALRELDGLKA